MKHKQPKILLEAGDAARLRGCSTANVAIAANRGLLAVTAVTRRGVRLYDEADVLAWTLACQARVRARQQK